MKKYLFGIALVPLLCASTIITPVSKAQTADAPQPQAPSTSLVISQIQPGITGSALDEFVEIHNVSANPIDLNGYRLVYRSQNGATDLTFLAWSTSTIVQPGHFFLIASNSYSGSAPPDSVYNTTTCSCSMSATNGGLAIRLGAADSGTIVDAVGWGTGSNVLFEGTRTVAPGSGNSQARLQQGCQDSDNNAADFSTLSPYSPRNSSNIVNCAGVSGSPSGAGASSPSSLLPGATSLLTVTVTPGSNPASTGLAVTADLSAIGGSATQDFFNDGTNGDAVAGDNIFSYSVTVAGGTAAGQKSLPFSVSDAQARTGAGTIPLMVQGTTNPTGTGSANPSTVAPGGSTTLTFNVTPGTNPTSTGITVTGDLSSIGGSAAQSFTNSTGNTFTFTGNVAANTSVGAKSLPITITDGQARTGTGTISLSVAVSVAHTPAEHEALGLPTKATTDVNNPHDYLIERNQYVESYDRDKGIPNWVAWHLDSSWIGSTPRQDDYRNDPNLPAGWYQVQSTDYSGSGFDRGHMCPSGDRTSSVPDNSATFLMPNFIPQAPNNNQGQWNDMENYIRGLLSGGANEVYTYDGGAGVGGTGSNGGVTSVLNTPTGGHITVPAWTWKVVIVLPAGSNDPDRVTKNTRVIAVIMPNAQGLTGTWQSYRVSVKKVEALTGFTFFTGVRPIVRNTLKYRVDTQ